MDLSPRDVTRELAAAAFRTPGPGDNKYSRGVVAFATGAAEYPGAGVLGVAGALGAGAGLVRYQGSATELVLSRFPEVVVGTGRANVAVIGSGWGTDLWPAASTLRAPVGVIDAGAMSFPALRSQFGTTVFTPHAGEAAALLGVSRAQVEEAPLQAAVDLGAALGGIIVLKGAATWIVGGEVRRVVAESHWAATAGSGDVLAGVIGAVIASGVVPAEDAVAASVWLHAQAAQSDRPLTATQIADKLPAVIAELLGS